MHEAVGLALSTEQNLISVFVPRGFVEHGQVLSFVCWLPLPLP